MLKIGLILAVTSVAQFLTFLMISETVQLALVGSVVPTIAAVGAILIGWWANRKIALDAVATAKVTSKEIAEVSTKSDKIIEQGVEIHTLTNSNLTRMEARLDVALETIKGLEALIKTMTAAKSVADDLSTQQASALAPVAPVVTPAPIPVVDEAVVDLLKSTVIDKLDSIQSTVNEPKENS